jgi:hypothetical protein
LQDSYVALLLLCCLQSTGSSRTVALANAGAADILTSSEWGEDIDHTSVGAILATPLALFSAASSQSMLDNLVSSNIRSHILYTIPALFPEICRKIVGDGSIPPLSLSHNILTALLERRLKQNRETTFFIERDIIAQERHISFPNPLSTLKSHLRQDRWY